MTQYTTKSFNLKVVEGVEVNDEASFKKTAQNTTDAIVLVDNIKLTNPNRTRSLVDVNCNIYGNNKMIYSSVSEYIQNDGILLFVGNDNTIISNVKIKVNDEIGDEITNWEDDSGQSLKGIGIRFFGPASAVNKYNETTGTYEDNRIHSRIEFCTIENCRKAIDFCSSIAEMEGCIIRNCLEVGVWVPTSYRADDQNVEFSNVTMKNNVFTNICGIAISLPYDGIDDVIDTIDRENKHTKIKIEGFIDIYNWQELNCLNIVPKDGIDESYAEFLPYLNSMLGDIFQSHEEIKDYLRVENGVTYLNMGIIGTGVISTCYVQFESEDERLKCIDTTTIDDDVLNIFKRTYLWAYDNKSNITPSSTCLFGAKLINHLHGLN